MCSDLSSADTLAREAGALKDAASDYPRAARRLLVMDRDARAQAAAAGIDVQPVYEWLLSEGPNRLRP